MKKVIWIIVAVVITAALTLSIVFGVQSCQKAKDAEFTSMQEVVFDNLQTEDSAYLRAYATSKDEITKITYQIDTAEEVIVSTDRKGKTTEDWKYYNPSVKDQFYIDTGDKMIDISTLAEGKHILSVYVYKNDVKSCIYELNFKVVKNS
ncbi:MAG: hypothetical protein IJ301_04375 [Clostridia bacterium]|nr:hypothetical protein [Clostridia bacterium]